MGNEKMEASARRTVNDAVASGAAVHAASLSGSGNTTNNDTTTPSFEIKADNKPAVIIKMFVDAEDIQKLDIFERNSTGTRIFSTYIGDELNVTIQACKGDRANNELDIDWTGISPTQRGVSQIEVTFDKTKNGALSQSKGCHMAVSDERSDSLTVTPMPQLQTADSNELSAFTFITNCLIAHQPNDVQCLQGLWAISMPLLEQRRVRLGAKHAQFWLRRQCERDAANSCADTLRAGKYRLGYELREGERRLQTLKLEVQELKREGGAQASPAVYALLATPPFLGAETKVLSVIIMRNTQVRCTKKKPESTTGASESQRRPAKAGSNTQQEQADHQRDRLETGEITHQTTGVRGGAEQKQDIRLPGLQQKEWLGSSLRQHFAYQQSGEQTTVEGAQGVSSKGSWWLARQAAETTEEKASGRWSLKEQHEGGYWPLELDRSRSGSDMAANGSQLLRAANGVYELSSLWVLSEAHGPSRKRKMTARRVDGLRAQVQRGTVGTRRTRTRGELQAPSLDELRAHANERSGQLRDRGVMPRVCFLGATRDLRFQGDLYSPMEKDGIFMQPNPDDHEHLWVLLNKLDDAEQLNDALLDGLRRDDIWHGDDAPGPSTYIAAPVSIPEQRRAPFKEFNDLDKQGAWMKNFTSKEAESLPSMMVLTKKRRKNEHGIELDIFKGRIITSGNKERGDSRDIFWPAVAISSLPMFSKSVVISDMSLKQGEFKQAYIIASVLERVGMDRANPSKTLGGHGKELQKFDSQEGVHLAEFQKPLGELRRMAHTNLLLGPQLGMIGRVQDFSGPDGVDAIKHVHRFLAGSVLGITAPTSRRLLPDTYSFGIELELEVHADASFLPQYKRTRHSILGSLVLVEGVAIKATSNPTSKKLLSAHQTELAAANVGLVEGSEVSAMIRELGVLQKGPHKLFCSSENESVRTVAMAALLKTSKSRMIWDQRHRLREEVAKSYLVVQSIPSEENRANLIDQVLRAPEQERQTRRVLVNVHVEEVIAQVG